MLAMKVPMKNQPKICPVRPFGVEQIGVEQASKDIA
jgi:hypothetical protein